MGTVGFHLSTEKPGQTEFHRERQTPFSQWYRAETTQTVPEQLEAHAPELLSGSSREIREPGCCFRKGYRFRRENVQMWDTCGRW